MAVITISRQYGSLGNIVANALGQRLGYRVVMRALISQAARAAGAPEVALAVIDELGLLGFSPTEQDYQAYIQAVQAVMLELAGQGNVIIVGRGGQVVLAGRPDTLHVRTVAPLELRVARIAERHGISLQAARAQVKASDRQRRIFLRRFYDVDGHDPLLYDLVINTAHMTAEAACNLVCAALEQERFH
jgi:cytidylate kinase